MTSSMKTTKEKQSAGRKRLAEIEYKMEEMEHELNTGADPAREVVALFAMRATILTAMEDGVFREADEERARQLMVRIRARIEFLRRLHPQNERT